MENQGEEKFHKMKSPLLQPHSKERQIALLNADFYI